MGVPILAAHLFVLYYGVLADDTPPINLPAYGTAGIARSEPIATGVQGFKFDAGALLLPFVFVTNTAILLLPENVGIYSWSEVAQQIVTALIGIIAFVTFIQNYFLLKYRLFERLIALGTSLVLIHGSLLSDVIGVTGFLVLVAIQIVRGNKQRRKPPHQETFPG
jgi:TRAP-type uncharacterized transport system fused permease subunit